MRPVHAIFASALGGLALVVGCSVEDLSIGRVNPIASCGTAGGSCLPAALCTRGEQEELVASCARAGDVCCRPCAVIPVPSCPISEKAIPVLGEEGCPASYSCEPFDGGGVRGGGDGGEVGSAPCGPGGGVCRPDVEDACGTGKRDLNHVCAGANVCCLP